MTPVVTDFTYYWFASREFLAGRNPYVLEPVHGLMMLAPPWILAAISPLGKLPLQIAEVVWLLISVAARSLSIVWLWQVYAGHRKKPSWAGWLIAAFVPVFMEVVLGQMDLVMLLGISGFLRYQSKRPYLAGMFLFLVAFKPQIAFLVWPALLLCALYRREWKPLAGFLSVLVGASLAVILRRPTIFLDYWAGYQMNHAGFYETAALLAGLPWFLTLLALMWLRWRWKTSQWEWAERMPELLLVSALASPHIWPADHVLLIPALIQAMVWLERSPWRIVLAYFYCGLNGVMVVLIALRQKWWYGGIIFVWLGLFLLAKKSLEVGRNQVACEELAAAR